MKTVKNKLAASVRQVKAHTPDKSAHAAQTPAEKAPKKTTEQPQRLPSDDDPPASGNALFPSRVWPD
ncbi:MAG: hypothetical protein N2441_10905 [Rhodocyclaceae bacterium]|nr:hypothetical protein [Rhodocyclaceae bacterium]